MKLESSPFATVVGYFANFFGFRFAPKKNRKEFFVP